MHIKRFYLSIIGDTQNSMYRGKIQLIIEECQWRRWLSIFFTDIEERKHGEQTGLDTLVVHAVKYEC